MESREYSQSNNQIDAEEEELNARYLQYQQKQAVLDQKVADLKAQEEKAKQQKQAQKRAKDTKKLKENLAKLQKDLQALQITMKKEKLKINESYLKRYNKKWTGDIKKTPKMGQENANAFMKVFKVHHKNNPFQMRMGNDGTMIFEANKPMHDVHIYEIVVALLSMGRFVHVNIGTDGLSDGSTLFYMTEDRRKALKKDKNLLTKCQEEGQKFINQFLNIKDEQLKDLKLLNKQLQFMQIDETIFPKYPVHRDVINAWPYSIKTPWCVRKLVTQLKMVWRNIMQVKTDMGNQQHNDKLKKMIKECMKMNGRDPPSDMKANNLYEFMFNAAKLVGLNDVSLQALGEKINSLCPGFDQRNQDINAVNKQVKDNDIDQILDVMLGLMINSKCPEEQKEKKPEPKKLEYRFTGDLLMKFEKTNETDLKESLDVQHQIGDKIVVSQEKNKYHPQQYKKAPFLEFMEYQTAKFVEMANREKGIRVSRRNNDYVVHIQFPKNNKCISRTQMEITHSDKGVYWAQQLRQTPLACYVQITAEHPICLQEGMVIVAEGGGKYCMIIENLDIDEGIEPITQCQTRNIIKRNGKKQELIRLVYQDKRGKVGENIAVIQGNEFLPEINGKFLKKREEGEDVEGMITFINESCYPDDQGYVDLSASDNPRNDIWKIITKDPDDEDAHHFQVDIEDTDNIQHWGNIYYERDTGWYIDATKKGQNSPKCLKILFKDTDAWYDDPKQQVHKPSNRLLIQDNMHLGVALGQNYVFSCKTRYRDITTAEQNQMQLGGEEEEQ